MKYKVTKEGKEKFQSNLIRLAEQKLCDTPHNAGGTETLEKNLRTRATKEPDRKISRGILRNTGGSLQRIPNFTGHKDGTDTQNRSQVVGRTNDNAEKVECAKTQVSKDKRLRGTTMLAQSTIPS